MRIKEELGSGRVAQQGCGYSTERQEKTAAVAGILCREFHN